MCELYRHWEVHTKFCVKVCNRSLSRHVERIAVGYRTDQHTLPRIWYASLHVHWSMLVAFLRVLCSLQHNRLDYVLVRPRHTDSSKHSSRSNLVLFRAQVPLSTVMELTGLLQNVHNCCTKHDRYDMVLCACSWAHCATCQALLRLPAA